MHRQTAREIIDGIRRWVEVESFTADVEGVNRLMTHVAKCYTDAGAKVERIAGRVSRSVTMPRISCVARVPWATHNSQ